MRCRFVSWLTSCVLTTWVVAMHPPVALSDDNWLPVHPGMELRLFATPEARGAIAVLRLDPSLVEFELGAAITTGHSLTVEGWAEALGCIATINAGMFRMDDRRRSTGLMRDRQVVVSSFLHPSYNAFFLFQPKRPDLPPVRFADRDQDPHWRSLLEGYFGAIQNYRLVGQRRAAVWPATGRRHSQAALGMDGSGRVLWIHCRPRLSMNEFAQVLLDLPLDLTDAMYLEGGADAALFISTPQGPLRFVGDYAAGLPATTNDHFWPVPNVLGARLRPAPGVPRP